MERSRPAQRGVKTVRCVTPVLDKAHRKFNTSVKIVSQSKNTTLPTPLLLIPECKPPTCTLIDLPLGYVSASTRPPLRPCIWWRMLAKLSSSVSVDKERRQIQVNFKCQNPPLPTLVLLTYNCKPMVTGSCLTEIPPLPSQVSTSWRNMLVYSKNPIHRTKKDCGYTFYHSILRT